jgi:hypothetical protein
MDNLVAFRKNRVELFKVQARLCIIEKEYQKLSKKSDELWSALTTAEEWRQAWDTEREDLSKATSDELGHS